jgi:beta-glucosidase
VTGGDRDARFPEGFVWGVSACAYQIEGAVDEGGRAPSVWDAFCHAPGHIWHGHTGDVACDHYHRWREDVELMGRLGVGAYRMSISWPRAVPAGVGTVNEEGMAFYDRLVDALLEGGIEPWVVLFHWDYPLALFRRGGWLNPDSPQWFAEYAAAVVDRLSDRVGHWLTMVEPACFIMLGHRTGEHAPGLTLDLDQALQAGHHALLAHGRAVETIRARAKRTPRVGTVACGEGYMPASDDERDVQAARELTWTVTSTTGFDLTWWLDPMLRGLYPPEGLERVGRAAPRVEPGDMETIAQELDFVGMNYYSSRLACWRQDGPAAVPRPPGYPMTTQNEWAVAPEGLYWLVRWTHERYGLPVVVTENGHQNNDSIHSDGKVHDPQRTDYLHRHVRQLRQAIRDGADVRGYFHWTLMDNFEWALGYGVRVGLVYTDFQSLRRTCKDSFEWYQRIIATHGACLDETPAF